MCIEPMTLGFKLRSLLHSAHTLSPSFLVWTKLRWLQLKSAIVGWRIPDELASDAEYAILLSAACIIVCHGPKCKTLPNPLDSADHVPPFASHILGQDDETQVRGYDRQSFLIACSMRAKHGQDASGHSFTPSFGHTWSHRRCRCLKTLEGDTSKTFTCRTLGMNIMNTCTTSYLDPGASN
jgi:hypothetical protein